VGIRAFYGKRRPKRQSGSDGRLAATNASFFAEYAFILDFGKNPDILVASIFPDDNTNA
jgi:hypothetical protein